jgi:formamidopyrimidine-DNA glycosylase
MSGSVRILPAGVPAAKHDHIDIVFTHELMLRYTDPRRFGCVLWSGEAIAEHPLLARLGPEPLAADFDTAYLYQLSRGRKTPIKSFIMDSHVVVGVGNIYANEALFMAGIRPLANAGSVSRVRMARLVACIKQVIAHAITVGGTTLRDFVGGDGKPGYFQQSLLVYGRGAEPCKQCGGILQEVRLSARSTVFCKRCQRQRCCGMLFGGGALFGFLFGFLLVQVLTHGIGHQRVNKAADIATVGSNFAYQR